jgi:signal transduction histidine kinase
MRGGVREDTIHVSNQPESASRPAVLVIDNDAATITAIRALLDPLDCGVVAARSGIEAVNRAHNEDYAAIVTDIQMPGIDGYEAAAFIRQHARSAATPILFFSGGDIDVAYLTREYGNTGQVDSLRKPFDPDVFRAKIRAWLDVYRTEQQVHELKAAVDVAQAEIRTKDDVLAMVAHDLRNPLAAMKMSVAALRQHLTSDIENSKLKESVRHHVELADRTVDRMARMVADLLDSVQIESTGLTLDTAPHAMTEIVAQSVESLSAVAEQKGILLRLTQSEASCPVRCDRDRIVQVLSNLLHNAIKFTPPGGTVHIETRSTEASVEVAVRDTGPGIPPDQIPQIFTKYWQGDKRAGGRGIGLGLSIAREIVMAHGGRIWVESQLEQGALFVVSIPRM